MRTTTRRSNGFIRELATHAAIGAVLAVGGCQHPVLLESYHGRAMVFPDMMLGRPTVLAFLSAHDRRCDREILPLVALHHRDGTPVQVIAVVVFDSYEYVQDVKTLEHASFEVLLDPDRHLAERFDVSEYPTYVFLDTRGHEIERANDVRETHVWVDSSAWHERAYGLEEGSFRRDRPYDAQRLEPVPGALSRELRYAPPAPARYQHEAYPPYEAPRRSADPALRRSTEHRNPPPIRSGEWPHQDASPAGYDPARYYPGGYGRH